MIWRSAVMSCYPALAIVVAIAYGGAALITLLYFYFVVAAWFVFLLVWESVARSAGRWNSDRIERTGRWTFGRAQDK